MHRQNESWTFAAVLLIGTGCARGGDPDGAGPQTLGAAESTIGDTATAATVSAMTGGSASTTSAGPEDADGSTANTTTPGSTTASDTATDTTGPSPTEGSDTNALVSWNRYTLDIDTGAWSTAALEDLWSGANAPPATGIEAAMSLTNFDRFWVLTSDGTFFEQSDGVWLPPVAIEMRFPMTANLNIGAMTHTPNTEDPTREDVFFIDNPTAVVYTQVENGGLELVSVATLADDPDDPEAAPQGSGRAEWYVPITDVAQAGIAPVWLQWYVAYDDGNLYRFTNGFDWTNAPLSNNVFFDGGPGEPDPTTIEAAYYDDTFARAHFIGP